MRCWVLPYPAILGRGKAGVFPIERHARFGTPVETRRLLGIVIAGADSDESNPVRGADVQAIGFGLVTEFLALK